MTATILAPSPFDVLVSRRQRCAQPFPLPAQRGSQASYRITLSARESND